MAAKPVDEAEAIRVYEKDIRILEETVNTGYFLCNALKDASNQRPSLTRPLHSKIPPPTYGEFYLDPAKYPYYPKPAKEPGTVYAHKPSNIKAAALDGIYPMISPEGMTGYFNCLGGTIPSGLGNLTSANNPAQPQPYPPKTSPFKTLGELESELAVANAKLIVTESDRILTRFKHQKETHGLKEQIRKLEEGRERDKAAFIAELHSARAAQYNLQDLSDSVGGMNFNGGPDAPGKHDHRHMLLGMISEYAHRLGLEMLGFQVKRVDLEAQPGNVTVSKEGLSHRLVIPSYINIRSQKELLMEQHLKLKNDQEEKKPLVDTGVMVRRYFLEMNKMIFMRTQASNLVMSNAEVAVEFPSGAADRAMFELGFISKEDEDYEALAETFKIIYGQHPIEYPNYPPVICLVKDMNSRVRVTLVECNIKKPHVVLNLVQMFDDNQSKILQAYFDRKGDGEEWMGLETTKAMFEKSDNLLERIVELSKKEREEQDAKNAQLAVELGLETQATSPDGGD